MQSSISRRKPEDPLDRWRRVRAQRDDELDPRQRKLDVVPPTLAEIDIS